MIRLFILAPTDSEQFIVPAGIASTASVTAPLVSWPADIVVSSIASTVSFGSATVAGATQTIAPSGIASTLAFGSATVAVGDATIIPAPIASTVTFGSASISVPAFTGIAPTPIASTVTFGALAVLPNTQAGGAKLSLFIAGTERAAYLRDKSLSIQIDAGSRGNANFKLRPHRAGNLTLSEFTPGLFNEVIVYHNESGTRLFGGEIATMERTVVSGTHGYYEWIVKCQDYTALLDRRIVARTFDADTFGTFSAILTSLVANELAGTGITYDGTTVSNQDVGEQVANYVTVGELMRSLAQEIDADYHIDAFKRLKVYRRSDGTGDAPFAIEQDDGNWMSLTSQVSRNKFWNRVIVRNSSDVQPIKDDEITTDGSASYTANYWSMPGAAANVTLDGVAQDVAPEGSDESTINPATGVPYAFLPVVGAIIRPNSTYAFPSGSTLNVTYNSPLSGAVMRQDLTSIATYGLFEHVEEVKDIPDGITLETYADGLLARGLNAINQNVSITTMRAGLECGQRITIDANGVDTAGVDGPMIIDSVSISDLAKGILQWRVDASTNTARNKPDALRLFRKITKDSRQPVSTEVNPIRFKLAETIPGFDNPGVEVGVPQQAFGIAETDGVVKHAVIGFNSGTNPVTVDILKNGSSITGGLGVTWAAGTAGLSTRHIEFSQNPVKVKAGDTFTLDVLSGDADAKDGMLSLVLGPRIAVSASTE
jgi:hypothetical protein